MQNDASDINSADSDSPHNLHAPLTTPIVTTSGSIGLFHDHDVDNIQILIVIVRSIVAQLARAESDRLLKNNIPPRDLVLR